MKRRAIKKDLSPKASELSDWNPFSRFNDSELSLLSGKITSLDIQKGCSELCLGCAVDAPHYQGSLPWEDLKYFILGMKEVKEKKGYDLIHRYNTSENSKVRTSFAFFHSSNPIKYRSYDSMGKEKTAYDVYKLFRDETGLSALFTISGWNHRAHYQQKAMEQIIEEYHNSKKKKQSPPVEAIHYSVKPFGAVIRRNFYHYLERCFDYVLGMPRNNTMNYDQDRRNQILKFKKRYSKYSSGRELLEKAKGLDLFEWRWLLDERMIDFAEHSIYVKNLIENMKTLRGMKVNYIVQTLHYAQNKTFSEENKRYTILFHSSFFNQIAEYAHRKSKTTSPLNYTYYLGIGRGVSELGLRRDDRLDFLKDMITNGKGKLNLLDERRIIENFFCDVNGDGELKLKIKEGAHYLNELIIPNEYFIARREFHRAHHHRGTTLLVNKYGVLASLQGKRIRF